jgi:transposase-like protein
MNGWVFRYFQRRMNQLIVEECLAECRHQKEERCSLEKVKVHGGIDAMGISEVGMCGGFEEVIDLSNFKFMCRGCKRTYTAEEFSKLRTMFDDHWGRHFVQCARPGCGWCQFLVEVR